MKKWLVVMCLTIALSMFCCARAEGIAVETGVLIPLNSGDRIDLDDDGASESIEYRIHVDEDDYDTGFTLRIEDSAFTGVGYSMNRNLYALRLDQYGPVLILVSDYGMSDDYQTSFFYWQNGEICPAGVIYSMPENMSFAENGTITTEVRADVLYTWFRESDFALASGYDQDWNISYYMYEIPRPIYSMGLIATLKVDLPLMKSRINHEVISTIQAGSQVILCATDDVEWVYVKSRDGFAGGWMRLTGDYGYECVVGEESMASYEVFDGLIFAD